MGFLICIFDLMKGGMFALLAISISIIIASTLDLIFGLQTQYHIGWILQYAIICFILLECILDKKGLPINEKRIQSILWHFMVGVTLCLFCYDIINILNLMKLYNAIQVLGLGRELRVMVVILGIFLVCKSNRFFESKDEQSKPGLFLSDKAMEELGDDIMEVKESVENITTDIMNNGNNDSMVFCINAPWGSGKTSFVNFCVKSLQEKGVIVYRFDPLIYQDREGLLTKYVDGLILTIKQNIYAPELELLLSKYRKFLGVNKKKGNVFGFDISIFIPFEKQEKIFELINTELCKLQKKILVVVDDLDRMDIETVKDILYIIKKSFYFNNISYLLCCDIENIEKKSIMNLQFEVNGKETNYIGSGAIDTNQSKQCEFINFIDKFIDVKYNLPVKSRRMGAYYNEIIKTIAPGENKEYLEKVGVVLNEICNSTDYESYIPMIGNVRKIKRLINTMCLLNFENVDFINMDIEFYDLTHLIILYINYPAIFKDLVVNETKGAKGKFSWEVKESKFVSSEEYKTYRDTIAEAPRFILNKIFDNKRMKIIHGKPNYYACLNDSFLGNKGNLEKYLDLINEPGQTEIKNNSAFYKGLKDCILNNDLSIETVFNDKLTNLDEKNNMWKILISEDYGNKNSILNKMIRREQENPKIDEQDHLDKIINFALNEIKNYPIKRRDIGFSRNGMLYYIVELLDKMNLNDNDVKFKNISNKIFGEEKYKNYGVFDLIKGQKDIILLDHLLMFRLYISINRSNDFFNVVKSLVKAENIDASVTGNSEEIAKKELRRISQKIFADFKKKFIDSGKNIFEEIENLTCEDMKLEIVDNNVMLDQEIANLRSFILYYLCCGNMDEHQEGCGYYDEEGEGDSQGIKKSMNEYIFNKCLYHEGKVNAKYFWTLIIDRIKNVNNGNNMIDTNQEYKKEVLKTCLDLNLLTEFWKVNKKDLAKYDFTKNNENYIINLYETEKNNMIKLLNDLD